MYVHNQNLKILDFGNVDNGKSSVIIAFDIVHVWSITLKSGNSQ